MISITSWVPRWEIINSLFWWDFRPGICAQFCFPYHNSPEVNELLNQSRGLLLHSVEFSKRATRHGSMYSSNVEIIFDRHPKSVQWLFRGWREVESRGNSNNSIQSRVSTCMQCLETKEGESRIKAVVKDSLLVLMLIIISRYQ